MEAEKVNINQDQGDKNLLDTLHFAKELFKTVTNKDFIKEYDDQARFQIILDKYRNFASNYIMVVKYMTMKLQYNETAFRKILKKMRANPQMKIEDRIELQAMYAKYLYIEESKAQKKHWSSAEAAKIFKYEYDIMYGEYKRIKKEEELAKNEFAEEKEEHLKERRKELLKFINEFEQKEKQENGESIKSEEIDEYKRMALGLTSSKNTEVNQAKRIYNLICDAEEKLCIMIKNFNILFTQNKPELVTPVECLREEFTVETPVALIEERTKNKTNRCMELKKLIQKMEKQAKKLQKKNKPSTSNEWLEGLNLPNNKLKKKGKK